MLSQNKGCGRIIVAHHPKKKSSEITSLHYHYPLKLHPIQIPKNFSNGNLSGSICYVLGYGGGLVGGDCVQLMVEVLHDACLQLLTPSSTKIYKQNHSTAGHMNQSLGCLCHRLKESQPMTQQLLNATCHPRSLLIHTPHPTVPYQKSISHQSLQYHLSTSRSVDGCSQWQDWGSLFSIEWWHSGRSDEKWSFSQYGSIVEVFLDGKRVLRESLRVSGEMYAEDGDEQFECLASVIMLGPRLQETVNRLFSKKKSQDNTLLWSVSPIEVQNLFLSGQGQMFESGDWQYTAQPGHSMVGACLRIAGSSVHQVREFLLHSVMNGMEMELFGSNQAELYFKRGFL